MSWEDLTGKEYHNRIVVRRLPKNPKRKDILWEVKCKFCGRTVTMVRSDIIKGKHTCMCLRPSSNLGKVIGNKFDVIDDIVTMYDSNGISFTLDLEDLSKVQKYTWVVSNGYVCNGNTSLLLHQYLMNCPKGKVVDHIDGNPLNCVKSNMRVCTKHQNNQNHKVSSNNVTGCTGVHLYKRTGKYTASIYHKGKRVHLGTFNTYEEAVSVRKEAEEKYFGEFRRRDY
jgi:hypothetical protein